MMSELFHTRLPGGPEIVGDRLPGLTFALGVLVGVGSAHEQINQRGISHALEQALFQAARGLPREALRLALDECGVRKDSALNPEWTRAWLVGLADDLPKVLPLASRCFLQPVLDESVVATAKAQALGRLHQRREQHERFVADLLRWCIYPHHPLGSPTLGNPVDIQGLTDEELQDFHQQYYRSGNMVVAVAGEFDWAEVVDLVAQHFQGEASNAKPSLPPAAPRHAWTAEVLQTTQQHVALAFPGPSYCDPRFYTWAIVAQILGGSASSRLFQAVRERLGLVYVVQSRLIAYSCAGTIFIYGATRPARTREFIAAILDEVSALATGGITSQELELAKTQLANQLIMRGESTAARMNTLLTSCWFKDQAWTIEQIEDSIRAVSLEDVAAVLATWQPPLRFGLATLGPTPVEDLYDAIPDGAHVS